MNLSTLKNGEQAIIVKVRGRGAFRKRITEMGFVKGKKVTVVKNAPLKDPIEYRIMDYEISLRRSEANLIEVISLAEAENEKKQPHKEDLTTIELLQRKAKDSSRIINVALVGNPNCGKTTLFNFASGSTEHVGNYSGVTVDAKLGSFEANGYTFNLVDLPGTYSLTAYSPEELYVRNYIINEVPDVIINVIDSSNLERNFYLTTQLIDMDIKLVVALNMYDELKAKGDRFNYNALAEMIGVPFVPTVSSKGKGINELFDKVAEVYEDKAPCVRHIHINYGKEIETAILNIQNQIKDKDNFWLTDKISSRFLAIKLLEKDEAATQMTDNCVNAKTIRSTTYTEIKRIEHLFEEDSETAITDSKYGFIAGALKETYKESGIKRRRKTEMIDNFITHKVFGFPIFIFFIWLMFQTTFSLGEYPKQLFEWLVWYIGSKVEVFMPEGMLKDLLIHGVIDGVGGVVVFLPNILILFFFISLMEDTGYMARVAFIMDKVMHKIGLHGKSFIPLIMGFGCNVPAIMATRTLENRNDRLLTMLINPLMSCSARLPVYVLIIGAFFPEQAGTVLFAIYLFGIAVAATVAIIFKKLLFNSKEAPFVMELPPYRVPTLNSTLRHMWHKGVQYLNKMGGIILVASVLVWALGYFPRNSAEDVVYKSKIEKLEAEYSQKTFDVTDSLIVRKQKNEFDSLRLVLEIEQSSVRQANSYIGKIGKFIEPAMSPLGFDWKMSVSILSGVAAKEIVVSTLSVLYKTNIEENENLIENLRNERYTDGKRQGEKVFNTISALSFLVFILIYFPCVAVVAAIRNESGSIRWALFTILYTTALAWVLSFAIYQVGKLFL